MARARNQKGSKKNDEKTEHDKVFRALSDFTRRELLRIISSNPGINVTALCREFPMSRFAVMKHLNILENARLIRREKIGTNRVFFIETEILEAALNQFMKDIAID